MAGDRIEQPDRRRAGAEVGFPGGVDETVVDDFLVVASRHNVAQGKQVTLEFAGAEHRGARLRRQRRDVVEAMHARHLFDQILLDLQIKAERRWRHLQNVAKIPDRQAQARKRAAHFRLVERHADHLAAARHAHLHRLARRQAKNLVADRARLPAADVEHQCADPLDVLDGGRKIDAALEAVPGLGGEIEAPRAPLNRLRPPECGLDEDAGGIQRDRGEIAAHDAGQRFDAGRIGDHADAGVDRHGLAVEQLHLFACLTPAHMQVITGDLVGIENVRGPTEFQHDVVGDIHQRRDRALAGAFQARLHPVRRRGTGVDTFDQAAGKSAAQVRCMHGHRQLVADAGGDRCTRDFFESGAAQCRHLAGDSEHRQCIGAVRCEFDVEHLVIEVEQGAYIGADRCARGQRQQSGMIIGQAQFARRAEHAFAVDAAHFRQLDLERRAVAAGGWRQAGADQCARHLHAGCHVRRTAHDVERAALAGIDLTYIQALGVRMFFE